MKKKKKVKSFSFEKFKNHHHYTKKTHEWFVLFASKKNGIVSCRKLIVQHEMFKQIRILLPKHTHNSIVNQYYSLNDDDGSGKKRERVRV